MQGNSIVNFSYKNGLIHKNSPKNGNPSPAETLEHVFVIQEDSDGNIWFGDRDTGV
ncbi:two-component regulator propeller domain-containing protein [Lutibacter sp.]